MSTVCTVTGWVGIVIGVALFVTMFALAGVPRTRQQVTNAIILFFQCALIATMGWVFLSVAESIRILDSVT